VLARCAWRPGELLARYGGEEFCILLPDSTLADARVVAQRCLDRLQQARIAHPASPTSQWLTISIGVASLVPRVGTLADALVELADGALYQAKRAGRARYVCAEEAEASAVTTLDAEPPAL
jgi:diguanylate cyclase (GGDEF)-like protein